MKNNRPRKYAIAIGIILICLFSCIVYAQDYDMATLALVDKTYWEWIPSNEINKDTLPDSVYFYHLYNRIPDRWEMRVDTTRMCLHEDCRPHYYVIFEKWSCDCLTDDRGWADGVPIITIDTTYLPKQMMFFSDEEIRKIRELLLNDLD